MAWIYAARSANILYNTSDLLFWPDRALEVFVVDNSIVSNHDIFPPSVANCTITSSEFSALQELRELQIS